ncbi:hypothetical protein ACLBWZ_09050 [Brucellaceae bacterium C25G]
MKRKQLTKLAIASALLIAPLSQAFAYSIHVNDGVYVIECKNGVKSQGSHLQVTHAEAEHFCKVRGSSIRNKDVPTRAQVQPDKKAQKSN